MALVLSVHKQYHQASVDLAHVEKQAKQFACQVEQQTALIDKQRQSIESRDQWIGCQQEQIQSLKQALFGRRSERYVDTSLQGRLFDEACISDEQVEKVEQAEQEIVVGTYQRRRGGGRSRYRRICQENK